MAITESSQTQPGSGEPPSSGSPRPRARARWRRWTPGTLVALVTTALVVLLVLAWTYQPVQFGDQDGVQFPGLPTAVGVRDVNTFGGAMGEIYAPPQRGVFTIVETIANNGPLAVTIEAVSIVSPQDQAFAARGASIWPLVPAGPVRWIPTIYHRGESTPTSGSLVAGLSLAPRESVMVGIPVRMAGLCYDLNGWTGTNVFYVKERFLFVTHWVAVTVQRPWIMHEQWARGQQAARGLPCLSQ
jgi:hypothetical protein